VPVWFAIVPLTRLPNSHLAVVVFALPLGMLAGLPIGHGLNRACGFHGWVPMLAGMATAAFVLILVTAVIHGHRPFEDPFDRALIWSMGVCGAGGTIARLTLVDA
jgi:predicted MFS family arabinose efflux permease